jgi:MFS family permease
MVRTTGVQIGLLAFAVASLAGIYAGNPATVILLRALLAMLLGTLIGQAAGWTAKLVLRDHLQRKKLHIDREHFKAMRALTRAAEQNPQVAEPQTDPAQAG